MHRFKHGDSVVLTRALRKACRMEPNVVLCPGQQPVSFQLGTRRPRWSRSSEAWGRPPVTAQWPFELNGCHRMHPHM